MTYADDFDLRDKDLCTINGIANAVDGLLASSYIVTSDGVQTTALSTYTDMTGISQAVTVADGETVLIYFECRLNIATQGDAAYWNLLRASTSLAERSISAVGAANENHWVTCMYCDKALAAGTYTYKMQQKCSAARNVSTYFRRMIIVKLQES